MRAQILNRLVLASDNAQRQIFSTLHVAQQERYLGVRDAVDRIREQGFTAEHCADLVCNEHLSVGTTRNINDRLTQVKDEEGYAKRLELARHCPTCHPTYLYLLILTILTTLRMTR